MSHCLRCLRVSMNKTGKEPCLLELTSQRHLENVIEMSRNRKARRSTKGRNLVNIRVLILGGLLHYIIYQNVYLLLDRSISELKGTLANHNPLLLFLNGKADFALPRWHRRVPRCRASALSFHHMPSLRVVPSTLREDTLGCGNKPLSSCRK